MSTHIALAVADARVADLQRAAIHNTTNPPPRRARHPFDDDGAVSAR